MIPGPRGLDALRTILHFRRDPLGSLVSLVGRYGDVVGYRYGPITRVLVNHPEGVNRILQDNHLNYDKNSPFYHMLAWFMGRGLITSDGELWRRQRRLAQPAFSRRKLEALQPMMAACTEEMVEGWRGRAVLDAAVEMTRLTLKILGLALFSQDSSQAGVGSVVEELQAQMQQRFQAFFPLPPRLPTFKDRRFRRVNARVRALILSLVASRRRDLRRPDDLLTSLLEARDPETGLGMPEEQLVDELVTFLLAGHETVSNTLAWALYLLSRHPDVRRRAEADVGMVERVIHETLRLFPSVCVYGRRSLGPDEICGYRIPGGQIVSIAPYLLHRHPAYWPNPEGFDPDRFLVEPARGTYAPFAAGPRQCIGNQSSLMEARVILGILVRRVRLNLISGWRVEMDPQVTLRPKGGLPMTVEFLD